MPPSLRTRRYGRRGQRDTWRSVPVVTAYILVQTEVGKAAQVAKEIVEIEGVQQAEDVVGPYDVIVRAQARTSDELGQPGGHAGAGGPRHHSHAHVSSGAPLARLGHLRLTEPQRQQHGRRRQSAASGGTGGARVTAP